MIGEDGSFELIEDDGSGTGEDRQRWASTPLSYQQAGGVLRIGPASGNAECLPTRRSWTVTFPAYGGGET